MENPENNRKLHILVLTDRDWTHPQGGGTGTNLYGQITRWLQWGHSVTVVAGEYEGSEAVEQPLPRLTIHRMGTRLTVFPRAARAVRRKKIGADADVVLEVINGIVFFTPLWLRKPHVALVHHVHRDHYVSELGRRGKIAAWLLETIPLRLLYRGVPFITISQAARAELVELGVPADDINVAYLGVEPQYFGEGKRSSEPTLLYLGRLKQYKRIEYILDALEAVPQASLDIAGEGDYRAELEQEIERRGLADRVRIHGHVSEQEKYALYGSAWVSLTASSAEGWCLTVMEAAAQGAPSAALRIGGLPESIVDGETGLLADTPEQLNAAVKRLVEQPELRDRLGQAAKRRAHEFSWDKTAAANLDVLEQSSQGERQTAREALGQSETLKAAGLAAASMGANLLALVFTIVFARVLGANGYGSLIALVSTFWILSVPGAALQVASARETARGTFGSHGQLHATLTRWLQHILLFGAALTVGAVILREQLASLIGVDQSWAAAAMIPTAVLWLCLSVQRGVLQGIHSYFPVGASIVLEALGRLLGGLFFVALGAGVTGAYLGTPASMIVVGIALFFLLRRRLGPKPAAHSPFQLRSLVFGAWAPILAMTLLALLQNIDVIVVKRNVGGDLAGAYIAAGVAAKAIIWVAVGLGFYLLPEAVRRSEQGLDPRPVLMRALALVSAIAIPAVVIFLAMPKLVLSIFGEEFTSTANILPILGVAMALLAVSYLTVQYLLALHKAAFLYILGLAVAVEPVLLSLATPNLTEVATVVLAAQTFVMLFALLLGFRARAHTTVISTA